MLRREWLGLAALTLHPALVLLLVLGLGFLLAPLMPWVALLGLPLIVLFLCGLILEVMKQLSFRAMIIAGLYRDSRRAVKPDLALVVMLASMEATIAASVSTLLVWVIYVSVGQVLAHHGWLVAVVILYSGRLFMGVKRELPDLLRKLRACREAGSCT
jgi:hypothetical protein